MLDRTWWLLVKSVGVVLPRDDEVATLHVHDVTFVPVSGVYTFCIWKPPTRTPIAAVLPLTGKSSS